MRRRPSTTCATGFPATAEIDIAGMPESRISTPEDAERDRREVNRQKFDKFSLSLSASSAVDPLFIMNMPEEPKPSWIPAGGLHDQTLAETWLFRLRRERFRSVRTGQVHDYFVTHLADGVHTIAVTPDDRVVLVRQFRAGSRRDSLETPGGLLEPGEDAGEAGARELLEETGYAGDPPESLG